MAKTKIDLGRLLDTSMANNRYRFFPDFCVSAGLPRPTWEKTFHPTRKWRWDFLWLESKIALEIDGGNFMRKTKDGKAGGHARGAGMRDDREKRNAGVALGWRVIVVAPEELMRPQTVALVMDAGRFIVTEAKGWPCDL